MCAHTLFMEPNARFNFVCRTGVIDLDAIDQSSNVQLFDIGVINKAQVLPTYCTNSAFTDPFGCSSFVDAEGAESEIR